MSTAVYRHNTANPGEERTCGPAQLDKLLTGWRGEHEWLGAGASVPQQQIIRDFVRSRAKAQKDIQKRLPVRQRSGMRSRDLPADPSAVRIYRDGVGHWYASFVVPAEAEPLPATGRVIGIDWGVRETATTTSDDHDLPHAEHGRKAAARLARYQRRMTRRRPAQGRPGSKGYRQAKRQAARQYKKVARQRRDTGRKWAKKVVRDHDVIAVEDFRPKFLAKSTMARKAADAAIGATKKTLIEMAHKHGRDLRLINPAYSTMDCAQCGARTKHAHYPSQNAPTPAPHAEPSPPETRTPPA